MSIRYVYLAGPMRGFRDFNKAAFDEAADYLGSRGLTVFNPAASDVNDFGSLESEYGDEKELANRAQMTVEGLRRYVFEKDLTWICRLADALVLLPNWEISLGAKAEKGLCEALNLPVFEYSDDILDNIFGYNEAA